MSTDPSYVAEQTGCTIGTLLSDQPLDPLLAAAKKDTATAAMGAVVTFEGIVRDHDGGRPNVTLLSYSAHPTAPEKLQEVTDSVAANHPVRLWAAHRTGDLKVGDLAFAVVAAAAHRGDAFRAAEECADRVKAEVPIWKEQSHGDGSTHWVGLE